MSELLQPISENQAQEWLGQENIGPSTPLRKKLTDLFDATDWVDVINIDTAPLIWQHLPSNKEEIYFDGATSTVPMKITTRQAPDVYQLAPGQSATVVGEVAYLMIEVLIKKLIVKESVSRMPNMAPGQARKFSFSDDYKQHELIKQIYLGKATPGMKPKSKIDPESTSVEDDLGFNSDEPQYQPLGQPKPKRQSLKSKPNPA